MIAFVDPVFAFAVLLMMVVNCYVIVVVVAAVVIDIAVVVFSPLLYCFCQCRRFWSHPATFLLLYCSCLLVDIVDTTGFYAVLYKVQFLT
ncbi:MAG: hypothetical protein ACI90V_005329 [Bacillariaceae sp.]|jgi:hypothetical protein